MEIKKLVEQLEASAEYREWSKQNKGFYLVHVFFMTNHEPQVGYYDKKSDKVITFDIGDRVVINPVSDVFKEKKTIARLELDGLRIDKSKALEVAKEFMKSEYPKEISDKEIILIQEFDGHVVYNITYFTKVFNTLNIKINAENSSIISHNLVSLVSFQK